ncbi:hypothetical protein Golax_019815, partial [Gossypium laxum]|nr:hypothetical protein [Gossypium laxum]
NGCETLEHVFWDCATAKEEWDLIRIKFDGAFQRSTKESCTGLVVRRPDRTVTQIGVDLGLQRVEIKGNALRKKWVGSHASNGGYEEEKANLSGRRSVPVCKEENGGGNLNRPMKHWGKDGA